MATVLIIDDDRAGRDATAELFRNHRWEVFVASDGDHGIEKALRHKPELIVCDLLMPSVNGFHVCRSIRQQLQPVAVIVVSARDYAVDRASATEAGADEYLVKPLTWENVSEAVERLLPNVGARSAPVHANGAAQSLATRVKLWGVRGSTPVPGPSTLRYGGNTSCVEVRADGEIIILDAGSGIRLLGMALEQEFGEAPITVNLLITHSHWDHIQGLPFFQPAYNKKNQIHVFGYEGARIGLGSTLAGQMETPFFPVGLHELSGNIAIEELKEMEFAIGRVKVHSKFLNHPGVCVGYRLFTSSGSIAYLPDNEPYELLKQRFAERENVDSETTREFIETERKKLAEFLAGADLLILDTQYTDEEYLDHVGWGHGSLTTAVKLALEAHARRLLLFHHDPNHDDAMIDAMVAMAKRIVAQSGQPLEIIGAREGDEIVLRNGDG